MTDLQAREEFLNKLGLAVAGMYGVGDCIPTAHTLHWLLTHNDMLGDGYFEDAELVRATTRIPRGTILGSPGDGSKRTASEPGMWGGHLAVAVGDYVVDPSVHHYINTDDCVFILQDNWHEPAPGRYPPRAWTRSAVCGGRERYDRFACVSKYHRQNGWKSAATARKSNWIGAAEYLIAEGYLESLSGDLRRAEGVRLVST